VETILDTGATGLRYFALYLPRAAAVVERLATGERLPTYEDVAARYYEQRGIDLGALDADIEVLTRIVADLGDRFDAQDGAASTLGQAWTGTGADRAHEHLAAHLVRADRVRRDVADVRCALVETSTALRETVARKARWVGARDASRVGGFTPEQIDTAIADWVCVDWLEGVFLPHVRDTVSRFTALCDATAAAVDDAYRNLACAFARVDDSAFPVPGPLVVGDCRPVAAPPAPCGVPPAVPTATGPVGEAGSTAAAVPTSLTGLGAPSGVRPAAPSPGSLVGGGSLALDGLVIEGAARAVGAVVGVVAEVALAVVDTVGDIVREAAERAESPGQAGAGCSLNLESDACCDAAPAPRDPTVAEEPEPDRPPGPPVPAAEAVVTDNRPEPEMPSPAEELQAAQPPETEREPEPDPEPEPMELQPPAPPPPEPAVDSCVPAPDVADAPTVSPPARGARSAASGRGAADPSEPVLAELGSEESVPDGSGAEIAEAGPL